MSDQLQALISRGAACVGGDVVFRGQSMGRIKNGVFAISTEGEAELSITEVEAVEVKAQKAPTKKVAPKKKSETDETGDLMGDLSDLGLGD